MACWLKWIPGVVGLAVRRARQAVTPAEIRVRLLGPVEVYGPAGQAALGGTHHRTIVAVLALEAGRPVRQTRLVATLWGDDPPRTAVKTLHSHVSRLRQVLAECGLPGILTTDDIGYALAISPSVVDVHRFEERVTHASRQAAEGESAAAASTLRNALGLWRADALADTSTAGWLTAEAARLNEVRLGAIEDMWDAELSCGRHMAAVSELERLLVTHPGRDRLATLHMLALYRNGRQADAIAAYHRLRLHLAEQLGVDPGPAAQRCYTAVLRRDPQLDLPANAARPAPARPAHLPAAVGHFTGRADALSTLDRVADAAGRVVVVSGPAGIGKTALAVHWAHTAADRFPAGMLFIDLSDHDPDAATPADQALARLLRALGVPGDRIPPDYPDLLGLYRTLTHNQPLLLLVDNALDADHVLPLVPPTASGLVLVTSRQRLVALATHHAVEFVVLDAFVEAEAADLLRKVVGRDRMDREPGATAKVARLCAGLPLALRIVAAKVAADPGTSIGQQADELSTKDRLDEMAVPGDSRSVRAAFASSYRALPPPAARLFRHLGLHPGRTFDAHAASAVSGLTLHQVHDGLVELAEAHLIMRDGRGRYRFHDLLRLYAAECAAREESTDSTFKAAERLFDWYLAVAHAANKVLGHARDRVSPALRNPPAQLPFQPDADGAHDAILTYLDGEHANMADVVRHAAKHGHETAAWQLTYLLTGFFEYRGHWTDRIELAAAGLAAAELLGDPLAEGLMYGTLGVACVQLHRFTAALDHLRESLTRMRAIGDSRGQGIAHNNMAVAFEKLGRMGEAIGSFERALSIHRRDQHANGITLALNNIGYTYAKFGEHRLAIERLDEALTAAQRLGSDRVEAIVLNSMGQAHLYAGDAASALQMLGRALAIRERIGDRKGCAETLSHSGLAHLRIGEITAAIDKLRTAEALSAAIGDEHLGATILTQLGEANLRAGRTGAARTHLHHALAIRVRIPDADAEAAIHGLLAELDQRAGDADSAAHHHRQAALRASRRGQ